MTVYHGSSCVIQKPDVSFSKQFLDFGPAFYVTSYREQAEKWARRKCMRLPGSPTPIVNVYELDDDLSGFSVLRFDGVNEQWLDFVCDCREGTDVYSAYDIITGRVANDDVFRTVQSFRQGDISKSRALELLSFAKPNNQFALRTERVIASKLRFVDAFSINA